MKLCKTIVSLVLTLAVGVLFCGKVYAEELLPGQVKAPSDFFMFNGEDGTYLCFKNAYSTYTFGQKADSFWIYPQIDWYDGQWHYTSDWDDYEWYKSHYEVKEDKAADAAGCLRLMDQNGKVFNGEEKLPDTMRVRFIDTYKAGESDQEIIEITDWSEEISTSVIETIDLSEYSIPAPTLCEVNKNEDDSYSITIEGSKAFYILYGLPDYRLVTYIEGKTSSADWTNLMSSVAFSPSEVIRVEIPESTGISADDEISFRCKYGIFYKGETIYSAWSDTGSRGVPLEDAEFISNGDVEYVTPGKETEDIEEEIASIQAPDMPPRGISVPLIIIIGVACVGVIALAIVLVKKKN